MTIEYYEKIHMGRIVRYVKDVEQRKWLLQLTKHATITDSDFEALEKLGVELIKVEAPKE